MYDNSVAVDQIQRLGYRVRRIRKTKTATEVIADLEGACVSIVCHDKISALLDKMSEKRAAQLTQRIRQG